MIKKYFHILSGEKCVEEKEENDREREYQTVFITSCVEGSEYCVFQ